MDIKTSLQLAWRTFFVLKKDRPEPAWARWLLSAGWAFAFTAVIMMVLAVFTGHGGELAWWRTNVPLNLAVSLSISYTIHAVYRSVETLLPQSTLDTIRNWRDWRSALFFGGVGIGGTLLGGGIGLGLAGTLMSHDFWASMQFIPNFWPVFLLLTGVIMTVNWIWWKQRWQQQALQLQLTEARLSLLHAQIEPHFLFNTLANVQSLMDADMPRARLMLEAFTDYLRTSLASMREGESSLGAELEMARHYLQLLQIRMGERLSFSIEAPDEARRLKLPPLLIQPLVENAIHHGLEPKLEGGHVRILASLIGGQLHLSVEDDGRGLDSPRRPGRPGSGMALDNIRSRLQTRYPDDGASLSLEALNPGTRATLKLPLAS